MAIAHFMLNDIVFLHRENIKQILLYVFSSYFLLTISPRKSTQSVHQIVQFQSQKCKSSFVWEGGHPSQTLPPLGRFAPSLAFSLQYCKSYPPLTGKFVALAPPDNRHLLRPWCLPHVI